MAIKRRELSPKMPSQPGGDLNLNKGSRHHPNYSLNSIAPNPDNPRKPDLVKAGIDVNVVKQLRKKPDEDFDGLEKRLTQWVEQNPNLTEAQRQYWLRFVNFAIEIGAVGLHQPITIRETKPNVRMATIISGERRFLAHWLIGATTISAMVSNMDDEKASMMALVENFQREDMSMESAVLSLRAHQRRFGHKLSMAQVGRLANVSKGSAQGLYYAINVDEDDPVFELLADGSVSKPYHLKKYFDDRAGKSQVKETSSTSNPHADRAEDGRRSNLTDGPASTNSESGEGPVAERSNLTDERQSADQMQADDQGSDRSNLTNEAQSTDQEPAQDQNTSRSNLTGRTDTEKNGSLQSPKNLPADRSNLTDGSASTDWESVRNFLAMVCLEVLEMQGKDYQEIAERIDTTQSANELEKLVAQIAAIHKQAEDDAS